MEQALTNDQRKWLGTAIAVAAADGLLADQEQALIEQICDEMKLSERARLEVQEMMRRPPSPVDLASWAISANDRFGLYENALAMAVSDGEVAPAEEALLKAMASVLKLTAEEVERIQRSVAGHAPADAEGDDD